MQKKLSPHWITTCFVFTFLTASVLNVTALPTNREIIQDDQNPQSMSDAEQKELERIQSQASEEKQTETDKVLPKKKTTKSKKNKPAEEKATSETPSTPTDAKNEEKNTITTEGNQCNKFTLDGRESYDPDKDHLKYSWDLGDGTTSVEPIVPHTYEKSGEYKVTLTVTDESNAKKTTTQILSVNIPPHAEFVSPDKVCAGDSFTATATKSFSRNGNELKYRWSFGDGTKMEGPTVRKAYAKGGKYQILLTADDNSGTVCSSDISDKTITVNDPPMANAGRDVIIQCLQGEENLKVAFDGSGSADANNDALEYFWKFGDGTTGEGKTITHQYKNSGRYTASLTVKDDSQMNCDAGSDTVEIQLSRTPQANAGEDISVCLGESLEFDGTTSYVDNPDSLFSKWDFGDGSQERGLKVKHIYQHTGTYIATLEVENAFSTSCPASKDTRKISVNMPPKVTLKSSTEIGCVGQEFNFEVSEDNPDKDKLEYFWSFGDGTILKGGKNVSHVFEKGGNFKVSIIADDGKESDCSSDSSALMVKINTPPTAVPGKNNTCCIETQTEFDGTGSTDPDGDQLTYVWDFGDGSKASAAKVRHTFHKGGSYNVTLRVDDNTGTECSISEAGFNAEINAEPVPVIKVK